MNEETNNFIIYFIKCFFKKKVSLKIVQKMIYKLLYLFLFFFLIHSTFYSQEKIEYKVDDNLLSVTISDLNANCCSGFDADYHINYNTATITISIEDTTTQKCRCNCNFDLTVNIGPIPIGKYTIVIVKQESVQYGYNKDKRITLGRKDFSIYDPHPKAPIILDFRQSPCKVSSVKLSQDENIRGGIELFPNPAAGSLSLKFNLKDNSDASFSILNFLGKEVFNYKQKNLKSGTNLVQLPLNDLPSGIYIGKVISSRGQIITFKLMWSK